MQKKVLALAKRPPKAMHTANYCRYGMAGAVSAGSPWHLAGGTCGGRGIQETLLRAGMRKGLSCDSGFGYQWISLCRRHGNSPATSSSSA